MAQHPGRPDPVSVPVSGPDDHPFESLHIAMPEDLDDLEVDDLDTGTAHGALDLGAESGSLVADFSEMPIAFDDSPHGAAPSPSAGPGTGTPDSSSDQPSDPSNGAGPGVGAPGVPGAPGDGSQPPTSPPGPNSQDPTGPNATPSQGPGSPQSAPAAAAAGAGANQAPPFPPAAPAPTNPAASAAPSAPGAAPTAPTRPSNPGAPSPMRPPSAQSLRGGLEQAGKRAAKGGIDSATGGLTQLPGLKQATNAALDAGTKNLKKKLTIALIAGNPVLIVIIVLVVLAALVGVVSAASSGSGTPPFPLPDKPTDMQRVLMPPGFDPVEAKTMPSTVDQMLHDKVAFTGFQNQEKVTQDVVPGWADVVYNAQEDTRQADFGIPWTVLAGIARSQTDFGRRSPYDSADRNPNRDPSYGIPPGGEGSGAGAQGASVSPAPAASATSAAPATGTTSAVSTVAFTGDRADTCPIPAPATPIGGGKSQGVGPFLLMPEKAAELTASGGDPQNPCDAAKYVAEQMIEAGADLYATGDYDTWAEDPDVAKKLWSDVIAASGLFADPNSGNTDCTAVVTDGNVGAAIDSIWNCEAGRRKNLHVVTEPVKDNGKVTFATVDGDDAATYLVSEAQAVAWNFSGYKLTSCDKNAALAGVFPLTAQVATKYGATDRCDPVQNIRAAAKAVLDGEQVPLAQRSTRLGPYQPMIGGWAQLSWALGTTAADFSRTGPTVAWTSDTTCDTVIATWLNTVQTALAADLDTLTPDLSADQQTALKPKVDAIPAPARTGYCAQANASQWNQAVALVAEGTDPTTTGVDATTANRYQVLSSYFAGEAAVTSTIPAAHPGRDSMVDRLTVTETAIAHAPDNDYSAGIGDELPMGAKIVEYAVGYGGFDPAKNTATDDVLAAANLGTLGADPSSSGAGSTGLVTGDVAKVIAAAKSQLGVPYSWGGGGPGGPSYGIAQGAHTKGFDCSGLMEYAYSKIGKAIGGTTYSQINAGKPVTGGQSNWLPGDLVLWPGHVAMYLGNGQVIHAPHTGSFVKIVPISWAHSGSPIAIRRIVAPTFGVSATNFPPTTKDAKALAAKLRGVGGAGYAELFVAAGRRRDINLDPALLAAIAMKESSFNPVNVNCSNTSSAGALGIMQLMPGTAKGLHVDPCNPSSAIFGAGRMMRGLLNQFGTLDKALAAYNWGPGNVVNKGMAAAPAETRDYIVKVPAYCRQFGGCGAQ